MIVSNFCLILLLEFHLVPWTSKLRSSNKWRGTTNPSKGSFFILSSICEPVCDWIWQDTGGISLTYIQLVMQNQLTVSLNSSLSCPGTKAISRGRMPTQRQGWDHHYDDHNWYSVFDVDHLYKGTLHCVYIKWCYHSYSYVGDIIHMTLWQYYVIHMTCIVYTAYSSSHLPEYIYSTWIRRLLLLDPFSLSQWQLFCRLLESCFSLRSRLPASLWL